MTFPWNKADQVSAEQVQLEAREEQRKFALAALDDAKKYIKDAAEFDAPASLRHHFHELALTALSEAIEQLEGRETP